MTPATPNRRTVLTALGVGLVAAGCGSADPARPAGTSGTYSGVEDDSRFLRGIQRTDNDHDFLFRRRDDQPLLAVAGRATSGYQADITIGVNT